MRHCFNCIHKKTDLWNFDYSDKNAHKCEIGNDDTLHKFMEDVKGLSTNSVNENSEFVFDCHEFSEHQLKLNSFVEKSNEILDAMRKTIEQ